VTGECVTKMLTLCIQYVNIYINLLSELAEATRSSSVPFINFVHMPLTDL